MRITPTKIKLLFENDYPSPDESDIPFLASLARKRYSEQQEIAPKERIFNY